MNPPNTIRYKIERTSQLIWLLVWNLFCWRKKDQLNWHPRIHHSKSRKDCEGLDSSSIRINKMEGDHETAPFHSSTQKGPKIKRLREDISVTKWFLLGSSYSIDHLQVPNPTTQEKNGGERNNITWISSTLLFPLLSTFYRLATEYIKKLKSVS